MTPELSVQVPVSVMDGDVNVAATLVSWLFTQAVLPWS